MKKQLKNKPLVNLININDLLLPLDKSFNEFLSTKTEINEFFDLEFISENEVTFGASDPIINSLTEIARTALFEYANRLVYMKYKHSDCNASINGECYDFINLCTVLELILITFIQFKIEQRSVELFSLYNSSNES